MAERLYYADPYCKEFAASVVERLVVGKRPAVVLDRGAFYPESGGQPGDRGTLNGVPVVDTLEREEDKAVVHVLAAELPDREVTGRIDWPRRFDHMQQHTGQHVLSQAFERLVGAETVGFHLGEDVVTIDLALDKLTAEQVAEVEDAANQTVYDGLPVTCRFVTDAELAALPLRKAPKVSGPIRIVEVAGYDWSACGGTHVASAGQIGLIAIRKWERRGQTVRVDFACGRRALLDYRWKNAAVNRLAAGLSIKDRELAETVERLAAEAGETRRQLNYAREKLLDAEAAELRLSSPASGVVLCSWSDRPAEEVRRLAQRLSERPNTVALLGSAAGGKANLVFARSTDRVEDMNLLLRQVAALVEGRGGGTPTLAQGGGSNVSGLDSALARAVELLDKKGT